MSAKPAAGQSAILEYLRFGLGRSAGDVLTDEESFRERDQELITDTLADGSVSVVLERDGVIETWTRRGVEREIITVLGGQAAAIRLNVPEAQQRFRARAFYQKQLSTLVLDKARTAEQITGIAAAEDVDLRRIAERDIAAAKRDVQAAYQSLVEFWVAEGEHRAAKAAVEDLRVRLAAIRSRMAEAGLSEAQQEILDSAPDHNLAKTLIEEARVRLAEDRAALARHLSNVKSLNVDQWQPLAARFPELSDVIAHTQAAALTLAGTLGAATRALDQLSEQREPAFARVEAAVDVFEAQHSEIVDLQASAKALFDETTRLTAELQHALAEERRSAAKLESLEDARDGLVQARARLETTTMSLRSLLASAAEKVLLMSEGVLQARVDREAIPKQQVDALMRLCDGKRIRDLSSKCEERAARAVGNDEHRWSVLIDALLLVRRHKIQTQATSIEAGDHIGQVITHQLLGDLTAQQLNGVYDSIDDATLMQALVATAEDFVTFEYRDGGRYISFPQASPGQQAAALLHLLLNQEAGTLVIDQPEDDLDNRVIMSIAKLLQTTKRKRQLIFATHNPNFVVNGDADKIVVLASGGPEADNVTIPQARIRIETDGAIETPAVRDAVTDTMEGGKDAFELRSRKYCFASG